jgi:HAMP domain-containing protein
MRFISLRWKISGILVLSNLFIGAIVIVIVHRTVTESLENELIERGRALAIDLSQYTSELILEEDVVGLTGIITRLLSFETAQYILIHDSEGSLITDTFNGNIPAELSARPVGGEINVYEPELITLTEIDEICYDIIVPVEEGSLGYIRIGMKRSYITEKVRQASNYIIASVLVITILGIYIVYFLANRIINPILQLAHRANEISTGNLEDQIAIKTNDEINFMAEAVERLRESLKIALKRLDRNKTIRI